MGQNHLNRCGTEQQKKNVCSLLVVFCPLLHLHTAGGPPARADSAQHRVSEKGSHVGAPEAPIEAERGPVPPAGAAEGDILIY